MRVLIATEPRMYRETLAFAIRQRRPGWDVFVAPSEELDEKVASLRPHTVVQADGVKHEMERPGLICWIGIDLDNGLNARIDNGDGEVEIHGATLEDILAAFDEADGEADDESR